MSLAFASLSGVAKSRIRTVSYRWILVSIEDEKLEQDMKSIWLVLNQIINIKAPYFSSAQWNP